MKEEKTTKEDIEEEKVSRKTEEKVVSGLESGKADKEKEISKKEKDLKEKPSKEVTEEKEIPKTKMEQFRRIAPQRQRQKTRPEIKKEFEEKVLEIKRVARVVKGGRRFKFRASVVIGNLSGKIGIGVGKGAEVSQAVSKASQKARKNMIKVPHAGSTIPFDIESTFKGAKILLKPAKKGTGIIAGGPVRAVVELAGILDISSKMLGSSNKINNMTATFNALKELSVLEEVKK